MRFILSVCALLLGMKANACDCAEPPAPKKALEGATAVFLAEAVKVEVEGQTDVLTMGIPYICPYNVNSVMNPILVMCLGLGYFFNLYRGKPLVRQGGVLVMSHPTPWEFHPVHHPSYIDFFDVVLADSTDPKVIEEKYEKQFAEDEWYRHLYRTSYAYHGVHPFYMWYWAAHAMDYLGDVMGNLNSRRGRVEHLEPTGNAAAELSSCCPRGTSAFP